MLKLTLPSRAAALPARSRRIAIVGGGFTGASLARVLSRRAPDDRDEIIVFEPRERLGTGLAYDTSDPDLRLHVAAHRMRAIPGDPGAFLAWLKRTGRLDADPQARDGDVIYARRADFGAFMEAELAPHLENGRVRHIRRRIQAITRENGHWLLTDATGEEHAADVVVIATSHPPAAPVPAVQSSGTAFPLTPQPGPLAVDHISPGDSVIIAGSGLTALDLVSLLAARGHRGHITLVSRRGLLPRRQPDGNFTPHGEALFGDPHSALELLRRVRAAVHRVTGQGLPWQSVMDALRHEAPRLWAALPVGERRRVRRHLSRWYDVHRHRMTPAMADLISTLQAEHRLTTMAGHILAVEADARGVVMTLRSQSSPRIVRADHLMVATGPDCAHVIAHQPYLQHLQAAGFVVPDAFGFGLACDSDSRALARDGHPVTDLYIAGPLARGTFGELMAVPEIAAQTEQVARHILRPASRTSRTLFIRSLPSPVPVAVASP